MKERKNMPTLIDPSNDSIWSKLLKRINKDYPKAITRLTTDKDSSGNIRVHLVIHTRCGGTAEDPTIARTYDISGYKDKVIMEVITIDNQKVTDKESIAKLYYMAEPAAKGLYIGVDADRITAYLDKSIPFSIEQKFINATNKLKTFLTEKNVADTEANTEKIRDFGTIKPKKQW